MSLRIGEINYLNLYPIFFTLKKECDPSLYQFISGSPSEVNKLLSEGKIDISPSSSIEFLRHPEQYILIDEHSISSKGPVRSILLFSIYPIEQLNKKTILATKQSESSTALLRIILKKFYDLETEIVVSGTELDEGLKEFPAYLLIGDDALKASHSSFFKQYTPALHIYDLGEIWFRNTGLPFVFALWMGRKECCESKTFMEFIEILDRAKDFALHNLPVIADKYTFTIMNKKELVSYWQDISYDLDEDHRKGLDLFKEYLTDEGILS